jgi:pimeloyl-ACP methyl ester carboxylesterase
MNAGPLYESMSTQALVAMIATVMLVCTTRAVVAQDRTRPSGMVPIGNDRTMYLECIGTGSPTVVLVSGFRGAHDDWTHVVDPAHPTDAPIPARSAVFPEVSRFTRVCAYDRPGTTRFGGGPTASSLVPQPTTAGDGAADLHALLTAARELGPFVVVAHSWGGLIARLFASQYPNEVVGLVLLDPGSEFLKTSLAPAQWAKFVQAAKVLGEPGDLELADYEPSVAALRAAAPVRAIPVVVLSSDKPFDFGVGGTATWPAWGAAQDRVATLLNARHITRTNSGHFIQGEQPLLVTKAIRQVVEIVRRKCAAITCEAVPTRRTDRAPRLRTE